MLKVPTLKDYLRKSRYDWQGYAENDGYTEQCTENKAQALIRGKVLGGSSTINSMIYTRGFSSDYDHWAKILDDPSWSWDGVYQYFKKSERIIDPTILNSPDRVDHGTTGYLKTKRYYNRETFPLFNSFQEMGHEIVLDITKNDTLGISQPIFTVGDKRRQSTAYSFLSSILDRKNLHVLKKAKATKILIDCNSTAYGVQVVTECNETINIFAEKEVIVSAGTINSAQLLMLSGIGPKKHLQSHNIPVVSDLPVGFGFQNQLSTTLTYKMGDAIESSASDPGEITSPSIIGLIALDKNQNYADYETYCNIYSNADNFHTFCRINAEFDSNICNKLYEPVKNSSILYVTVTMLQPNSKGRVYLRSADPDDTPLVRSGYYSEENDIQWHTQLIRHFRGIENTTYFRKVNAELVDPTDCGVFEFDSDEYWRCYILCIMVPDHHYSSTCAMGSVVDSRLRVYNVKGLRVADASIIPYLVRGHSYAPTMMIAEKASDMIKEDHQLL